MSHKIAFREYGHGPLLILLHGYGGSVMHWDPVVEKLSDRFRVVVPNLSHLYMSKNRLLFPVIVDVLAEFIRTNFPGRTVSLAGASFGGAVAWGLSVQHPDLIDRVMLFNALMPHPVKNFRLPETRYFFVMPLDERSVVRLFKTPIGASFLQRCAEIFRPDRAATARGLSRMSDVKLNFVAGLIAHFSWILRNEDWKYWEGRIAQSRIPTLVVWSKDDMLFDDQAAREFSRAFPLAKGEELSDGGHVLSKSRAEDVARLCAAFLAKPDQKKPAA